MAGKQKGRLAILHRHYDKIVAVLVLVGLLISLLYLSQSSRRRRLDHEAFQRALAALLPSHPESSAVDEGPYRKAQQLLNTPYQMQPATNRPFLVAEERVWCIECRQPIPFDAEVCPLCQKPQPGSAVPEEWDSDGDGLPDAWERKHGLNPLDPADAGHDPDGDGFSNLEEFQSGSDPTNPASHPPRVEFLRVQEIVEVPFPLILLGSIQMPDGPLRYQVKDATRNQDFYVFEGQEVGPSGFKVVKSEIRKVKRAVPGWPEPREVDVHFVTVQRGQTSVVLEEGAPGKSSDFSIVLRCTKDREPVDYRAKSGENFTFDQEEYEVISVDRNRQTVVIRRLADRKQFAVPGL